MPVWAISCFFVRRGYRRQGVMSQLIVAALKTAKRARASALEAYPIDTSAPKSTSNTFTGTAAAFTRAGFKEVARRASARPIMRHDPKTIPRGGGGASARALWAAPRQRANKRPTHRQ